MHTGSPPQFDLAAHQRGRISALERDNRHLEIVRRRLERIIALLLRVAAGDDCDPIVLLGVIQDLDLAAHHAILEARQVIQLEQERRDASNEDEKQEAVA